MKRGLPRLDSDVLEFAPAILSVQEKPPAPLPRAVLGGLLLLFSMVLVWAAYGRLDVIASAEGRLIPQSYLKIVQPADAGIVQEILVTEGDTVAAGQVLLRMDAVSSQADTRALETELKLKGLQLRRIEAELADSPLVKQSADSPDLFTPIEAQFTAHRRAYQDALAQEQAVLARAKRDLAAALEIETKLKRVLPVYQAQAQAFEKLQEEGFAGNLVALDKQRERVEKEQDLKSQVHTVASLKMTIAQAEKRLAQITSSYRQQLQDERVATDAQWQKLQQEWVKQQHKNSLLELKAPQAGIVKEIATHTAGTVVSPGTILMTLVPRDDTLQAEVMVRNEDVGFVHESQPVKVKFAAYPFQKYGMVEGVVTRVSADASETSSTHRDNRATDQRTAAYQAIVTLKSQAVEADGQRYQLTPGMQVVAEIKLGDRTVWEYLLSPVRKTFHEAGRER